MVCLPLYDRLPQSPSESRRIHHCPDTVSKSRRQEQFREFTSCTNLHLGCWAPVACGRGQDVHHLLGSLCRVSTAHVWRIITQANSYAESSVCSQPHELKLQLTCMLLQCVSSPNPFGYRQPWERLAGNKPGLTGSLSDPQTPMARLRSAPAALSTTQCAYLGGVDQSSIWNSYPIYPIWSTGHSLSTCVPT